MIYYVTGPLGAGKSYYACRKMAEAFLKGKAVVTNIRLTEGWEKIILGKAPYYRFSNKIDKAKYEDEIRSRYAYVPEISELVFSRIHGRGQSRGIRVIDEAHNEVNNREWAEGNQKLLLRTMSLSRKRGWDDYIIAQHKDNTDAALRRIAGIEIRLLDWQQITRVPFFQVPLLPFHLFLALAFTTNVSSVAKNQGKPLWKELFPLGWQSKIYNTFQDFSGSDLWAENFWQHTPVTVPVPKGFDWEAYQGAKAMDEMIWGYLRSEKIAAAEAAAISAGIVAEITTRRSRPSRQARTPLPPPSSESRTSTPHPRPATSGSGA